MIACSSTNICTAITITIMSWRTPIETVATLSGATNGVLSKSRRYLNVLQPAGFHDEMRAALVLDGMCWGVSNDIPWGGPTFF